MEAEASTLAATLTIEPVSRPQVLSGIEMDKSLAAGLAWTAGAKWSSQLISWGALVVVTRLLAPSDFGLVGMAALYSGLLLVVTDALGTAVTTLRELTGEQLAQLNSVASMCGVSAVLISCVVGLETFLLFALGQAELGELLIEMLPSLITRPKGEEDLARGGAGKRRGAADVKLQRLRLAALAARDDHDPLGVPGAKQDQTVGLLLQ